MHPRLVLIRKAINFYESDSLPIPKPDDLDLLLAFIERQVELIRKGQ